MDITPLNEAVARASRLPTVRLPKVTFPTVGTLELATKSLVEAQKILQESGSFRAMDAIRGNPELMAKSIQWNAEKEVAPIQIRNATYALTEAMEALLESLQQQAKAINSLAASSRLTAWLTGALAVMTLAVLGLTALLVAGW
jgi:hypothetical protein